MCLYIYIYIYIYIANSINNILHKFVNQKQWGVGGVGAPSAILKPASIHLQPAPLSPTNLLFSVSRFAFFDCMAIVVYFLVLDG